jgi:crotonobetainyl-CoA:carnitine CoA-transferase CaiB-like acyl-CoA transferase
LVSVSSAAIEATEASGPLKGIRVLDMTSVLMGPYATQMLGDLGAEVVMIEPLGGGTNRRMGADGPTEFSWLTLNLLRNKRCVSMDVRDAQARDAVLKVAATCQVVVTNFRTDALQRLGLSYEDVVKVNPDIVYCQANGFRSDSDRAADPAYDDIIQSDSGFADAARRISGIPTLAPMALADKLCSMAIVSSVLAALVHVERTGQGQKIEVPMLDVVRSFVLVELGGKAISEFGAEAGYNRVLSPSRGPQPTKDGWITIMPYSARAFDALFAEGGRHDLVGDPRSRDGAFIPNCDFLYAELAKVIAQKTTDEWLDFCAENDIAVGEVTNLTRIVEGLPVARHPQVGPYHVIPSPVDFGATPTTFVRPAGQAGQDTVHILSSAGVDGDTIDDLLARRVAYQPGREMAQ